MSVDPFAVGDDEEFQDPNTLMALEDTSLSQADIDADAATISASIYDAMAVRAPGWIPHDGSLDTWLIDEFSIVAAEVRQEALNVPGAIFQTYGEEVLGIPVRQPAPAQILSNWTAVDNQGYTIPAGTQFALSRSGDDQVVFNVVVESYVQPGTNVVTGVQAVASDMGVAGNGLYTTPESPGEIIDPLAWVTNIDCPQPSSQGDDGQTVEEYLDLLVSLMRMVALRPILPWDFAILALRIPGVGRAIAMDGYEPTDDTWGHERQITLMLTDAGGEPCDAATKQAVRDQLEQLREVNFIVNVIDAHYIPVDVAFEVVAFAEQDAATVLNDCTVALTSALMPNQYRLGTTSPAIQSGEVIPPQDGDVPPGRQTLHINDFISLLDHCRGVDWVVPGAVTINGVADDYQMPNPYTLPYPGAITGTVSVQ